MSPVQSRARTPSVTDVQFNPNGDEYFGVQPHMKTLGDVPAGKILRGEAKRKKIAAPGGADEKRKVVIANNGERRKSSSGSSISSMSSGRVSKTAAKHTSHG
jgi:hypothetical protein